MFNRMHRNPIVNQYAVVAIVNLNILAVGVGLLWPSPVLVKLMDPAASVLGRPITAEEGGWIVSLGGLVGGITNFLPVLVLDHLGRKYSLILSATLMAVAAFLQVFGTELWIILLARSLYSAAAMFMFTIVPVYASEIASKEIRGSLGIILQVMTSLGIVIMLNVGPFISYTAVNILFAVVVVTALLPSIFLPDSPYFLYTKGRNEEAVKVLTFLRGSEKSAKEELKYYASQAKEEKVNKILLFKSKTFLKALGLAIVVFMGSQLIGFNTVQFYLQTILESTKTSISSEIASVIIGLLQLFASIFSFLIADRFNRKPILACTLVGIMSGMIGLGTFFYITEKAGEVSGVMNYLPLLSLILVVISYSAGPGSIMWPLASEMFDSPARVLGLSICNSLYSFTMFPTTRYFAQIQTAIGPAATYWGFGFMCMLFCLFAVFCLPETKGKSFAEIQKALGKGAKNIIDVKKPEE